MVNFENLFPDRDIPLKISPCPIHQAIVEVRFETDYPNDAVFGIFYGKLRDTYSEVRVLPIQQVPEVFRNKDPELKIKPHYELHGDGFNVLIGPCVFSILTAGPYPGWNAFQGELEKVFTRLLALDVAKVPTRLGIRYINFFKETNVYELLNVQILSGSNSLIGSATTLRSTFNHQQYSSLVQISNESKLTVGEDVFRGSVFDIDVSTEKLGAEFKSNFIPLINEAHKIEKRIFFPLLSERYKSLLTITPA
jgi:uncharacterized protein (TIGR04255 family)